MIHHMPQTDVPQFETYHPRQGNGAVLDVRGTYICLTDTPRSAITLLLMRGCCWRAALCFAVDVEQSGLLGASISNEAPCVCVWYFKIEL